MSLPHAKRTLLKAVYTPIDSKEGPKKNRAIAKWSLVAGLAPNAEDFEYLGRRPSADTADAAAIDQIRQALDRWAAHDFSGAMNAISTVEVDRLVSIGQRIADGRREAAATAIAAHDRLLKGFTATNGAPAQSPAPTAPNTSAGVRTATPGVILRKVEQAVATPPRSDKTRSRRSSGTTKDAPWLSEIFERDATPAAPTSRLPRIDTTRLSTQSVIDWASTTGTHEADSVTVMKASSRFGMSPSAVHAADFASNISASVAATVGVLAGFRTQMKIEPVGLLHLERLTFEPAGIERGELLYSVPLAPGEQVNLTHKEWSNTSEEFQTIVSDELDQYSETGVSEKHDIAQSTQSQTQHSSALSAGVTASGGYGPITVTTTVNGSVSDAATKSAQESRNQSIALTRKASARSKREHKVSFKVASASGTEDQAVRRFANPFADKATRVDYYGMMRKWQVNHYRYGIRLTYDLTIPEPGSDIMSRIREIDRITAALGEGFGAPDATLDWARFDITPQSISRHNYLHYATQYGVSVPAPPPEHLWFDQTKTHTWKSMDDGEHSEFFSLEVTVPDDYEIDEVARNRNFTYWLDKQNEFIFGFQDVSDFFGVSGTRAMLYQTRWLASLYVELRVRAKLRQGPYDDWKLKTWSALRDAAKARYDEQRGFLKDRLTKLTESLGARDALSLRKAELDEIMKGVLRFLFGPEFAFNPTGLPLELYGDDETLTSKATWNKVTAWGHVIEFLHQAIEWENVLYFLYPYFWSHVKRWEEKKYLDHPDPRHREFLRAGSARVVLTIRPGFERDFISLLDTGSIGNTHPYVTIVEQMEDYAKTNFPGIPPANPEGADAAEAGLLIGSWYEYTPTSAIDIAFGETLPSE